MKYEPEEKLIENVQSGEYGWKEYITRHSRELAQEYEWYCHRQGLDPNGRIGCQLHGNEERPA